MRSINSIFRLTLTGVQMFVFGFSNLNLFAGST